MKLRRYELVLVGIESGFVHPSWMRFFRKAKAQEVADRLNDPDVRSKTLYEFRTPSGLPASIALEFVRWEVRERS